MAIAGICLIGFGIGTFYPNFISKHNIEEKAVDKTVLWAKEIGFAEPRITVGSDDEFIKSMQRCIAYLNLELHKGERIPDDLIIAQAIIESNAGLSRFAREGNNLFGIRVWNKTQVCYHTVILIHYLGVLNHIILNVLQSVITLKSLILNRHMLNLEK
jgi:hypothetical protein